MAEIKDFKTRKKLFPAITKALGTTIQEYLDANLGKGNYQFLWGSDDASLTDESGNKIRLRYPCVLLVNPEIKNYRLVQSFDPVIKEMDRDRLQAKAYYPSKPVKLVYELRVMTTNPDNDESLMLTLQRASEEVFSIYAEVEEDPSLSLKLNVWWGEGKKYSYDVENITRVYDITISAEVESRKYKKVRLIDPLNPVNYSTYTLDSRLSLKVFSTMFPTEVGDLVVYINEEFHGLPLKGTLTFEDWSEETVSYTSRQRNKFTLEKPLEHIHLQGTALRIGEQDANY